jgi:hypothetical protein
MKKTKVKTKKVTSVKAPVTATKKSSTKIAKPAPVIKKTKPAVQVQAPTKIVKKDSIKPTTKLVAAPQVKKALESKIEKTPVKKAITEPKEKVVKSEIKTSTVKVLAQGNARVIEPLSWDAEKPKLNMMLTQKTTRKDKDKEETEVKSYSIKSRYTVGDRVMHTDFGKGLVRDLIGDFKIRVAFRDFEKVLVHGIN